MSKAGLFTTLRCLNGALWFWPAHLTRLRTGAAELGLRCPDEAELKDRVAAAVGRMPDARVRVTLHAGREPTIESAAYAPPAAPWRLRPVVAAPRREQVRLKTTARGVYDAARRAAGTAYDDALLFLADGCYLEATVANLFLVDRTGRLRTPPATAPLLAGIARDHVLAVAAALGLVAVEGPLRRPDAAEARECFVTNALFVAHPVVEIEGVGAYAGGEWAGRLKEAVIQGVAENRIIH